MVKEFMLVGSKIGKKTGIRDTFVIIDKLSASGLREAEKDFKTRNNFQKLLERNDLTIVKSERFYQ